MDEHEIFMYRCLQLATLGAGYTAPNPMVGAVLVHKGQIIGEGYHKAFGKLHAEREAIAAVEPDNQVRIAQATLYVNLEPCSHYGKTPPCTNAILENNIKKVVVGCQDPFEEKSGKGIDLLRSAGVEVIVGILEQEARWLNRRFITFHEQKRPYIILKWAQTADGFLAPAPNTQQWISNKLTQILTHQWRTEEAAIMVGANTFDTDKPQLTARLWQGKQPIRIIASNKRATQYEQMETDFLIWRGFVQQQYDNHNNLNRTNKAQLKHCTNPLNDLFDKNILSVLVEGGQKLLQSFIDQQMWDEARIFVGTQIWGKGIEAPTLQQTLSQCLMQKAIGNNQLRVLYNLNAQCKNNDTPNFSAISNPANRSTIPPSNQYTY